MGHPGPARHLIIPEARHSHGTRKVLASPSATFQVPIECQWPGRPSATTGAEAAHEQRSFRIFSLPPMRRPKPDHWPRMSVATSELIFQKSAFCLRQSKTSSSRDFAQKTKTTLQEPPRTRRAALKRCGPGENHQARADPPQLNSRDGPAAAQNHRGGEADGDEHHRRGFRHGGEVEQKIRVVPA